MYWWFAKCRDGTIGYAALREGLGVHYWSIVDQYVKGDSSNGVPNTWKEFLNHVGLESGQKSRKLAGDEVITLADIYAGAVVCKVTPGMFLPAVPEITRTFVRHILWGEV